MEKKKNERRSGRQRERAVVYYYISSGVSTPKPTFKEQWLFYIVTFAPSRIPFNSF